jgi:hypothetical protein
MLIGGVKICCSLIGVQCVGGLVVTRLVLESNQYFVERLNGSKVLPKYPGRTRPRICLD